MSAESIIIIPARMGSTRFNHKPLALIAGHAMIKRVWSIAQHCKNVKQVLIATDAPELKEACEAFGAQVVLNESPCHSGSDRVAQTLLQEGLSPKVVFNLQGDAVLTPPWVIEQVIRHMLEHPELQVATPMVKLEGEQRRHFIEQKKQGISTGTCVTFDKQGYALYFSKSLLPYSREGSQPCYRHIGLYAYRPKALLEFITWPQGEFESSEHLEQLRFLEHRVPIKMVPVDYRGRTHGSVDRPEDVEHIEQIIQREGELVL